MPEQRIEGLIRLVKFQTMSQWFFSLQLDAAAFTDEWYQVDGGKFSINGKAATAHEALCWLVGVSDRQVMPRVVLTGLWGPNVYQECKSMELFSE